MGVKPLLEAPLRPSISVLFVHSLWVCRGVSTFAYEPMIEPHGMGLSAFCWTDAG